MSENGDFSPTTPKPLVALDCSVRRVDSMARAKMKRTSAVATVLLLVALPVCWYGESHVSFSREFLTISGQEVNAEGEAHGEFSKTLGLLPCLILAPLPDGPRFRKKLLG